MRTIAKRNKTINKFIMLFFITCLAAPLFCKGKIVLKKNLIFRRVTKKGNVINEIIRLKIFENQKYSIVIGINHERECAEKSTRFSSAIWVPVIDLRYKQKIEKMPTIWKLMIDSQIEECGFSRKVVNKSNKIFYRWSFGNRLFYKMAKAKKISIIINYTIITISDKNLQQLKKLYYKEVKRIAQYFERL